MQTFKDFIHRVEDTCPGLGIDYFVYSMPSDDLIESNEKYFNFKDILTLIQQLYIIPTILTAKFNECYPFLTWDFQNTILTENESRNDIFSHPISKPRIFISNGKDVTHVYYDYHFGELEFMFHRKFNNIRFCKVVRYKLSPSYEFIYLIPGSKIDTHLDHGRYVKQTLKRQNHESNIDFVKRVIDKVTDNDTQICVPPKTVDIPRGDLTYTRNLLYALTRILYCFNNYKIAFTNNHTITVIGEQERIICDLLAYI